MAPKTRAKLPPFIGASTWSTVAVSLRDSLQRNGVWDGKEPRSPKMTNGEAVTVIMALMEAAGVNGFPLWYQFAAVAYGWSPSRDVLITSGSQRDALYPKEATDELAAAWAAVFYTLDDQAPTAPRLNLDGMFSDPTFQAQVRTALQQDGADAQWKILVPGCKDPKTGKPTGRPHKDKNGKWTCEPVVVDDPGTVIRDKAVNGFATLAMLAFVAWLLTSNEDSPRRSRAR